jgi:hypothetical protein
MVRQKAAQEKLSTGVIVALDEVEEMNGGAARQKTLELVRGVMDKIRTKNAEPGLRDDERIDVEVLEEYCMPGLAKLSAINEKVTSQLLDRYLTQRGYLPLLRDLLESAAFVEIEDMMILRGFYQNNGKKFINNPTLINNLLGYIKAYEILRLGRGQFQEDLFQPAESAFEVTSHLGSKGIEELAKRMGIKVDLKTAKTEGRDLLKEWDMRFLGELIASQNAWNEEQKQFFKALLTASLEGKSDVLVYPPAYQDTPADVLGEDTKNVVVRVRQHNLGVLKKMEELGLNVNAWLNPNEAVKPVDLFEAGAQRAPMETLRDFKKKLDALKREMEELGKNDQWQILEGMIGTWAKIDPQNTDPRKMMNFREPLAKFQDQLQQFQSSFERGRVPEAVADMWRVLEEVMTFDQSKPVVKEFFRIRFWRREAGQDVFLGNCAGSCASLGNNAAAVFQFILDQGTTVAVLENQRGDVKGYARFFLAVGKDERPLFFIDTIDGKAREYIGPMKEHINGLARAVGLAATRVYDRKDGVVEAKLGKALMKDYFHHSGVPINVSQAGDGIDNWQPQGGWAVREEPKNPNQAMMSDGKEPDKSAVGGIDLSADRFDLEIEGAPEGSLWNLEPTQVPNITIDGLVPIIINITPMTNIPLFLSGDRHPSTNAQFSQVH